MYAINQTALKWMSLKKLVFKPKVVFLNVHIWLFLKQIIFAHEFIITKGHINNI